MAKKKQGRPKVSDPVILDYVYLRRSEKKRILKKHKTLTTALKEVVLPECG